MPTEQPFTPIMLTERFLDFLRFLEAKGGTYQGRIEALALELDLSLDQTRNITARADELKLVRIATQGSSSIGLGRMPNVYELRVTADEWRRKRNGVQAKIQQRRNEKRSATIEKRKRQKALERAKARERAERLAKAEKRTPTRVFPEPGTVVPTATKDAVERNLADPDLDVDAWAGAEDWEI